MDDSVIRGIDDIVFVFIITLVSLFLGFIYFVYLFFRKETHTE
jgi:hypothetical protein